MQANRNAGLGGLFVVVLLFIVAYGVLFPGLFTLSGFAKFTQSWFPLALVAMAQALLMLTGGISLAIGATVSLGAVIAATTMTGPLGVAGGSAAVALAGLAIGAATGLIVVKLRLPAIVVTLAGSFIVSGAALLILPRPGGAVPDWLSNLLAGNTPTAFVLLVVVVLLWKLYLATPLGLSLYAAGDNPVGAFRSGVPVDAARIAAYAISGLLSTGAGLFVAAQTGSGDPVIGTAFTLNSIAAAVLGGIGFLGGQGTMRGALAGSLLLSLMISVMFFLGFTPVAQYVAQGLIIIGAVALPQLRRLRDERDRFPRAAHRGDPAQQGVPDLRRGRGGLDRRRPRQCAASAPSAICVTWSSLPPSSASSRPDRPSSWSPAASISRLRRSSPSAPLACRCCPCRRSDRALGDPCDLGTGNGDRARQRARRGVLCASIR